MRSTMTQLLGRLSHSGVGIALALTAVACGTNSNSEVPTTFEEMTLVVYPGYVSGSPPGSSCDGFTYPATMRVDAGSRRLSWDHCAAPPGGTLYEVLSGERVLTDEEFESVREALDAVTPSDRRGCGADASVITLDLRMESETKLYADAFYAGCPWEIHRGRTFVDGLGELGITLSEHTGANVW
jgi:hypothetical protein